jgi:hypothetical protein
VGKRGLGFSTASKAKDKQSSSKEKHFRPFQQAGSNGEKEWEKEERMHGRDEILPAKILKLQLINENPKTNSA